jgi:arylsulfatase A-like enzyme
MGSRNLVLVCLDTVRKDFFDEYAPRLREEADVVYEDCRAASSWSAPSHASMFTGVLPHEHGVHAYHRDFSELSREDTFLGDLPDYDAYGASANVWASSSFGFDRFFDDFSDVSPDRRFPDGLDVAQFGQECERHGLARQAAFLRRALEHDRPLRSLGNGALVQLDRVFAKLPIPKPLDDGASLLVRETLRRVEDSEGPFFAFVNFMDAHGPLHHIRGYDRDLHDAPLDWSTRTVDFSAAVEANDEETLGRYRGLYGAAIDYLDRTVLDFFERVQRATDRETTFVITADHGNDLALDDRSLWGHTHTRLTEGLLHVPCAVLNAPGEGRDVVAERVSHLRLGELLVGLANGERPDVTDERIAAERIGYSGPVHTMDDDLPEGGNRVLRCAYEDGGKFLWDADWVAEAYELDRDRPCVERRLDEAPDDETIRALDEELFALDVETVAASIADADGGPAVDAATQQRLADLGYM